MEFLVDRPARRSFAFLSFVMLCSSSCVALHCVAICCVLCSCLFPVVLRCVVLRFAVCIVLVFSLLCCVVLCCDLLVYSLDIFLLSFTFVPAQDGTTRPTDNGFTSTTSSTNATQRWSIDLKNFFQEFFPKAGERVGAFRNLPPALACVQTSPISFHPRKRDVCETVSLIVFQYPAVRVLNFA